MSSPIIGDFHARTYGCCQRLIRADAIHHNSYCDGEFEVAITCRKNLNYQIYHGEGRAPHQDKVKNRRYEYAEDRAYVFNDVTALVGEYNKDRIRRASGENMGINLVSKQDFPAIYQTEYLVITPVTRRMPRYFDGDQ